MKNYIKSILENLPQDWLNLTTHRLDIYTEELAKTQFIEQFEVLYKENIFDSATLSELPTAFDYIRLGHPLSCLLEWVIAKNYKINANQIICFSSKVMPIMAILRKNLFEKKQTQIVYTNEFPIHLDIEILKKIYGYNLELKELNPGEELVEFRGSRIFISETEQVTEFALNINYDFLINTHPKLGSVILVNGEKNADYISEIQHVRRRESIAMTPANCFTALNIFVDSAFDKKSNIDQVKNTKTVLESIKKITGSHMKSVVGSSGLSIQYAITMGLIHDATERHPGKAIKIVVPPNCYGGTNDQARRIAACLDHVDVVDLPVDGDHNMVESIDTILDKIAIDDAVPYIIAEIPTNPRVEVPDMIKLQIVLSKVRKTSKGENAIDPVFILDQTFCPNVHFLREKDILSSVRTISYVSGSKFPSGGKCTAGYCVGNEKTDTLMDKIELHLIICDNEATDLQYEILANQMPSMNQRIADAYENTREFVNYIKQTLPNAKINFVSDELANVGFTPSVFSLDLPTKGNTDEEKESYKRSLNLKLIQLMIQEIPNESKFCVSYGQLKGCYWTIPATSTQGTTKEGDKDYIVRVALSPDLDIKQHKTVFSNFVKQI